MNSMFKQCYQLEYLDLSNFDTFNVTNMEDMFCDCFKLKEIKGINNLKVNKVESMGGMFQLCNELEYLDLSDWNTQNVKNVEFMFAGCIKLKEIKGINNLISNKVVSKIVYSNYALN